MRVLITHLTRMSYPRVCVAGLDEDGRYIRPVVGRHEILNLEAVDKGLLELGNWIDLGGHEFRPQPPEVEDCYFELANARLVGKASPKEFWFYLKRSAKKSLDAIFGEKLDVRETSLGTTLALPAGVGKASLGDFLVEELDLVIRLHEYKGELKLRGVFAVGGLKLSVAVTDLRFYNWSKGAFRLDTQKVQEVRKKLGETRVILSLGLSRAKGFGNSPETWHWLQINGVHLESEPLWK